MALSENEIVRTDTEFQMLEALVIDNPDFERLEQLLGPFNIFEAIGAVRQELRHSDFLAFLFTPQQNHGLGDYFLKRLMQNAIRSGDQNSVPITPIDLDIWSLEDTAVLREWQNIDILLLNETYKLAIILENKIDSGENRDQLKHYWETVEQYYPEWLMMGIFLTPDRAQPSDTRYIAIDYGMVCSLLENVLESRGSSIGSDARTLILHYTQMLRRHIVSESTIAELCRKIYRKHQKALDLIFEHRPDKLMEIHTVLTTIVNETEGMALHYISKTYTRFILDNWNVPALVVNKEGLAAEPQLYFEFECYPKSVRLKLIIGPGSVNVRQALLDMALKNGSPFKCSSIKLFTKWNSIYSLSILNATSAEYDLDKIEEIIRHRWLQFITHDLPRITEAINAESWIWDNTSHHSVESISVIG